MLSRRLAGFFVTLSLHAAGQGIAPAHRPFAPCRVVAVEGEVHAGQPFQTPALAGVDVRLDPVPSGWVLRVVPAAHPGDDWAEMATPPYRSVTPLAVTTDWSFRAQDAVGWNPRRFRFAANPASFAALHTLRQTVEAGKTSQVSALAELSSRQPGGTLEILDAHLVPGTADQARAASLVSGHFATTAHELEQPSAGQPTPLGVLTWIRFRVTLELPPGARAAPGRSAQPGKSCGGS